MQMLNVREVAKMLGCCKDTVWRKARNEPDFPKPVRFSVKCTRWEKAEVEAWLAAKLKDRSSKP